jgi:hypothetical protein
VFFMRGTVPAVASDLRKGINEGWFREVNERLEHRAAKQRRPGGQFEILCECDDEECTERIAISFLEYETVRADPRGFIALAGHVDSTCERIVDRRDGYEVVQKTGEAGMIAEVENPRDG